MDRLSCSSIWRVPPLSPGVSVAVRSIVPGVPRPPSQTELAAESRQMLPESPLQQVEVVEDPGQMLNGCTQEIWSGWGEGTEGHKKAANCSVGVDVVHDAQGSVSGQVWIQISSGGQSNCDGEEESVNVQDEDTNKHVNQRDQEVQHHFTGRPEERPGPDQAAVQTGEAGQRELQRFLQGAGDRVQHVHHRHVNILGGDERKVDDSVGEIDEQADGDAAALQHGEETPTHLLLPTEQDMHGEVSHHLQALQQPFQSQRDTAQHDDSSLGDIWTGFCEGYHPKYNQVAQFRQWGVEQGGKAAYEGDDTHHGLHHCMNDEEMEVEQQADHIQAPADRGDEEMQQSHGVLAVNTRCSLIDSEAKSTSCCSDEGIHAIATFSQLCCFSGVPRTFILWRFIIDAAHFHSG